MLEKKLENSFIYDGEGTFISKAIPLFQPLFLEHTFAYVVVL